VHLEELEQLVYQEELVPLAGLGRLDSEVLLDLLEELEQLAGLDA